MQSIFKLLCLYRNLLFLFIKCSKKYLIHQFFRFKN